MTPPAVDSYLPLLRLALEEDVGSGDVTSMALVGADQEGVADLRARQDMVVAGLTVAAEVFRRIDSRLACHPNVGEGQAVEAGTVLMRVQGPLRAILTAERTALNFLQHLSGIATFTARYVRAVHGTGVRILDTRKTLPGWRHLEKHAVACGGGANHRRGLHDMVLIKDNHLAALAGLPDPVGEAVRRARQAQPSLQVEVEADTLEQAERAAAAGADAVLLDNMAPAELTSAVRRLKGRCRLEASGGVTLETVRELAEAGIDDISIGALTHSAPAVDIGLDDVTPARGEKA